MKIQLTRNQGGARHFPDALKKEIINAFKTTGRSKACIWREYFGEDDDHGKILNWMRNFERKEIIDKDVDHLRVIQEMAKTKKVSSSPEDLEKSALLKRIKELEKQVEEAEMKALAFSTLVDVAEEVFNIPIRKKPNTKP
jgi:transposase